MTREEGKKLQAGQRVRFAQPGQQPIHGTVTENTDHGVKIAWDNGLIGTALYTLGDAPFNCLSLDSSIEDLDRQIEELRAKIRALEAQRRAVQP